MPQPGSVRDLDLELSHILHRYRDGYYPYYDRKIDKFYWDREPSRTIIEIEPSTREVARRELRKRRVHFDVRWEANFDGLLSMLADEHLRPDTWVKGKVLDVYRTLRAGGHAYSVEAYHGDVLAGGVLLISMPGIFAAETMVSRVRGASGVALYTLVATSGRDGPAFLDVQVKHDAGTPCRKLGETTLTIADYLQRVDSLQARPCPGRPEHLGPPSRLATAQSGKELS